jgi:hypothetical protein
MRSTSVVSLVLPVSTGRRHRNRRVSGTVEGLDEVYSGKVFPGVRIRLDWEVNGVDNCYATYRETDAVQPSVRSSSTS